MNKYIEQNSKTIKTFAYCVRLSWRVSRLYTILQFLGRIASVFLPVLVTWNTKEIIITGSRILVGTDTIG